MAMYYKECPLCHFQFASFFFPEKCPRCRERRRSIPAHKEKQERDRERDYRRSLFE